MVPKSKSSLSRTLSYLFKGPASRQTASRQISPRQTSPRVSPRQTAPIQTAPRQTASRQTASRQTSPRQVPPNRPLPMLPSKKLVLPKPTRNYKVSNSISEEELDRQLAELDRSSHGGKKKRRNTKSNKLSKM